MDLEIRFKDEQRKKVLLYCKNVDKLDENELHTLKDSCESTLSSFIHSVIENENYRPTLNLKYEFLDKNDLLNRIFNGQPSATADFDFENYVDKHQFKRVLYTRIDTNYRSTNEYFKNTYNQTYEM